MSPISTIYEEEPSYSENGGRPPKDVQEKLRQSFKSRREKGKVPYPVKYSQSQLA